MPTQVIMPQLGESVVEGTVGRWLVAEGQPVQEYDPLLAVTTDKVDTEIPAPASGVLLKILVPEGETVAAGTLLALIGAPEEAGASPDMPTSRAAEAGASPSSEEPPAGETTHDAGHSPTVTPLAQRWADDHGVDLRQVSGTGPGGRITKEDVEAYLSNGGARPSALPANNRPTDGASVSALRPSTPPAPETPTRRPLGFISPAVARLAAEFDVDLTQVVGTGADGRITRKDVQAYIAAPIPRGREAASGAPAAGGAAERGAGGASELPAWEQQGSGSLFKPTEEVFNAEAADTVTTDTGRPVVGPTQPAPTPDTSSRGRAPAPPAPPPTAQTLAAASQPTADDDVLPLTAIRRSIAKHMILSKQTSAHVTTVMEADLTAVVRERERLRADFARQGVKLTYTPFFIQAIIAGLQAVPEANSTLQGDNLLVHRRIHIGMATAIADGLIVPVIRDANEKNLLGLARAVNDLAARARAKQLTPDEVQGATFTLTNHGTSGSLFATPIINQPQAGILGVGAIQKRAVVISRGHAILPDAEDYIAIRPMVYLSFTFDHRILDGAGADGFLAAVVRHLEDYPAPK
jgi:pyruvate/2-oxoglutarate dehydrogenase complex dihydrolipoamide acyltransferase (E2) component